jgi:hypothetical protein
MNLRRVIIGGIALAIAALPAMAVENAVGRSLPGVWVMPQGAVVLAIDTKIFAPTGAYKLGNLSNLGMNEWTIQPNLSHTYLRRKSGQEIDNYVGFDIYSRNPTTRYTSGTVFHWDGMLFQYLSERVGFGAIVSNLTQISKDSGPLSNLLNGFQGSAWGPDQLSCMSRDLRIRE